MPWCSKNSRARPPLFFEADQQAPTPLSAAQRARPPPTKEEATTTMSGTAALDSPRAAGLPRSSFACLRWRHGDAASATMVMARPGCTRSGPCSPPPAAAVVCRRRCSPRSAGRRRLAYGSSHVTCKLSWICMCVCKNLNAGLMLYFLQSWAIYS